MTELNFDQICRICLKDSGFYVDIYKDKLSNELLLMELIEDFLQLDVAAEDGLPKFLCSHCYNKVVDFEAFKRFAHECKAVLQTMEVSETCARIKVESPTENSFEEELLGIHSENEIKLESETSDGVGFVPGQTENEIKLESKTADGEGYVPVQNQVYLVPMEMGNYECLPFGRDPLEANVDNEVEDPLRLDNEASDKDQNLEVKVKKTSYKYCFVPHCGSTTAKTPKKLFFNGPMNPVIRSKWFKAAGRVKRLSPKSYFTCCEDHFNVEDDVDNITEFRMGITSRLLLKKGVIPHIFSCQGERKILHEQHPWSAAMKRNSSLAREILDYSLVTNIAGVRVKKTSYKYCFVPHCGNSTAKDPKKLFFNGPKNPELRSKWFTAAGRVKRLSPKSYFTCCEDHFNVEEDVDNITEFRMGITSRLFLKKGVIPHIFSCQEERKILHEEHPWSAAMNRSSSLIRKILDYRPVTKIAPVRVRKTSNKYCFVPYCGNSTAKDPKKLFFNGPMNPVLRSKWFKAAGRVKRLSPKSYFSCCEDHFNVEDDVDNMMEYRMGKSSRLFLKKGVIPHIFSCQEEIMPKKPP